MNGALSPERRAAVVKQLARFTGLSEETVDRSNLRISPWLFMKELLRDRRQVVGRFDGRITGVDPNPIGDGPDYDPSLSRYFGIYSATINSYQRSELGFETDLPYEVLSGRVQPWDYGKAGNGYLNTADDLRDAIVRHPNLRVLVASGRYDLATPYLATNYTLDHLDLGGLRKNVTQTYYDAGHMMYHHAPSAASLGRDVAAFVRSSIGHE
jgi:carboxypeptidase C (cathepsin A)